jgi:hypothetical protein
MGEEMNNLPENKLTTAIESALIMNDLSKLSAEQRIAYCKEVCDSMGLNILTQPFEFITLNGKLTLYAKRTATDQLRKIHNISIHLTERTTLEGVYTVVARAKDPGGREDESTGAVFIQGLKGESLANAILKAETKAKRRVTLSICGLGFLDETEVASIPARDIGHPSVNRLADRLDTMRGKQDGLNQQSNRETLVSKNLGSESGSRNSSAGNLKPQSRAPEVTSYELEAKKVDTRPTSEEEGQEEEGPSLLDLAKEVSEKPKNMAPASMTAVALFMASAKAKGFGKDALDKRVKEKYGVDAVTALKVWQLDEITKAMENK